MSDAIKKTSDEILQTFGWLAGSKIVRIWTDVRDEGPLRGVWTFVAVRKGKLTAVLTLEADGMRPGYLAIEDLDGGRARLCPRCMAVYSATKAHACRKESNP